jgi:hypothetical protein
MRDTICCVFINEGSPTIIHLITTYGHPCTCSIRHQMLVIDTMSTQSTVFSVTDVKQGSKHILYKQNPKLPNVLLGRCKSFGRSHCVAVQLVTKVFTIHSAFHTSETTCPATQRHIPKTYILKSTAVRTSNLTWTAVICKHNSVHLMQIKPVPQTMTFTWVFLTGTLHSPLTWKMQINELQILVHPQGRSASASKCTLLFPQNSTLTQTQSKELHKK